LEDRDNPMGAGWWPTILIRAHVYQQQLISFEFYWYFFADRVIPVLLRWC
jgi:hypothetical protein